MDDRSYVTGLMSAVPEAFTDSRDDAWDLDGEPLPYVALGTARIWLEENALDISTRPMRATVRADHVDVFRRFWDFVEMQAQHGNADTELATLLQIECFEGVGWVEDVSEYLGPSTRALLRDAQRSLARYSGQIGRWAETRD